MTKKPKDEPLLKRFRAAVTEIYGDRVDPIMAKSRRVLALASLALGIATGLMPGPGLAAPEREGVARAMFGVQEVVIQHPRFNNSPSSRNCGVAPPHVVDVLRSTLRQSRVPAMSVDEAPRANSKARIYLIPEIYSYNSASLECISWVALRAESHERLRLPSEASREITITISYWREGSFVASAQTSHDRPILDEVRNLAASFADQFHLDQSLTDPSQSR